MDCKYKVGDLETADPFWDRLCDQAVPDDRFDQELLQHLEIAEHPKAATFISLAHKLTDTEDLSEIYLTALMLIELL